MKDDNQNIWAVFSHLSTFSKFLFPFGNIMAPLIIWLTHTEDKFISANSKASLNFQISWFLYATFFAIAGVFTAFFIGMQHIELESLSMTGDQWLAENQHWLMGSSLLLFFLICLLFTLLFVLLDIILVIKASIAASNKQVYRYPLSIPFFKIDAPK